MASVRRTAAGIHVVDAGQIAMAPGTIEGGRIADPPKLIEALKALRKQHKVRARQVTLSLPTECTVSRMVELREEDPQRIGRFVQDEIRQYATLSGRDTVSDFQVVTSARSGVPGRALIVGADRGMIDAVNDACRRAGLQIGVIEPAVTACVRLFGVVKDSDPSGPRWLLAICRDDVLTVCIFNLGVLDFIRTKGVAALNGSDRGVQDEINAAIQFYDAEAAGKARPWRVAILDAGDSGVCGDRAESLRNGLLADSVEVWTQATLAERMDADSQSQGAVSVTVLGSALRGLSAGEGGPQVNLLPADAGQAESAKRTVLVTANALATLVLLVTLAVGGLQILFHRTARNISAVKQAQLKRGELGLTAAMDQLEYVEERSRVLSDELDSLRSISQARRDVNWVELLADIRRATPQMVRIVGLSTDAKSDMLLDGISRSYEGVHTFVALVNRSEHVQQASLLETYRAGAQEGFVRFAVRCSLHSMETP
jgi:Tfp pilus assembly protein PilN